MAQLNSSNISAGNTIETTDILQLYDALTAGGGTTGVYNVSLSGSITGSATTATNASKLNPLPDTTSNNRPVLFMSTSSADYEQTYKANDGKFTYNPTTELLTATSSFAVTASYANNGGIATQVSSQAYSNTGGAPLDATFKFYAGKVRIVSNAASTGTFPGLVSKTLGTNVWVTATIEGTASSFSGAVVTVKGLSSGVIQFETLNVANGTDVHFHVIYVP